MKKALVISSSPRRNGNSFLLAESALTGLKDANIDAELVVVEDYISHFLKDCRTCRKENGECALEDNYRKLFLDKFLPADGAIFATPLYWYGMSAQLKAFFDRSFCYYAASYPKSEEVVPQYMSKRYGLVVASEETYPSAPMGIIHSIQEFSRYTRSEFVGYVQGTGNKRGDVTSDPTQPLARAKELGANLFTRAFSDYHLDTPRAGSVWNNHKLDESCPS